MSKRRFTLDSSNQKRIKTLSNSMLITDVATQKTIQTRKDIASRLMQKIRCKSQTKDYDNSQQQKDKVFHRRIYQYKQLFQSKSNTQTLPFIISLRTSKNREKKLPTTTVAEPFEVSNKLTINQKIKKKVSDINATPSRIFGAEYRLRSSNGASTRVSCDFECGLREQNLTKSVGEPNFVGYIRPGKFKLIQERKFKISQLICHRQEKSFTLSQDK